MLRLAREGLERIEASLEAYDEVDSVFIAYGGGNTLEIEVDLL